MQDFDTDAAIADRTNTRDIFPRRSSSKIENREISAAERNRDPLETERAYRAALAQAAAVRASDKAKSKALAKARRAAKKSK